MIKSLEELIAYIDQYTNQSYCIYAVKDSERHHGPEWVPGEDAVIMKLTDFERSPISDMEYLISVDDAHKAIEDWSSLNSGLKPNPMTAALFVIWYATSDRVILQDRL